MTYCGHRFDVASWFENVRRLNGIAGVKQPAKSC